MTESKRFYLNQGEVDILKIIDFKEDNETIYRITSESDMKIVVKLLNELAEENKQLKEERNYFERKKCEYFNKYNKKHLDNIQLKKENEQLKQEIETLQEQLAHIDEGMFK